MIVSLSLIRCDTVLRLECQQIVTHYLTVSCCVQSATVLRMSVNGVQHLTCLRPSLGLDCILIALRLKRLMILHETQDNYYN